MMADVSDEDVAVSFDERLLVFAAPDVIPENLVESVPIDITGTVRVIDEDGEEGAIEQEFGFDIEDGILDIWDDEPVLIATSITAGATQATIEIERIVTDALAYVGTPVTTGGVVEEPLGSQAFVLTTADDDDDDAMVEVEVLVVGQQDVVTEEIVDEAFVQVSGTPYVFDPECEKEFGDDFPFLFEDEAYDNFDDGGIVIVVDSITVER